MADAGRESPKIHIDSDWKASAQAEKDRLVEKERARETRRGEAAALPKATFGTLADMLASQAVMSLGALADPKTGRVIVDPAGAKFSIDLLTMLEEKTQKNLSKEEGEHLQRLLHELRARFVQVMQLVASHGAGEPELDEAPLDEDETSAEEPGPLPETSAKKSRIITE